MLIQDGTITIPSEVIMWLIGGFATIFVALIGLIWRKHETEFMEIKEAIDLKADGATFETNRTEMRQAIIAVHNKIESIDQRAQDRHQAVMQALIEITAGGKGQR